MSVETLWLVLGAGLGLAFALLLRRFVPALRKPRQTAAPPVYASRQELRKAMREREKNEQSVRKGN